MERVEPRGRESARLADFASRRDAATRAQLRTYLTDLPMNRVFFCLRQGFGLQSNSWPAQYCAVTSTIPVSPFSEIVSRSLLNADHGFPFTVTLLIDMAFG